MGSAEELNYHFKQLLAGATPEIAMQFGEALLAVEAQRSNAGAEAPGLLRKAWLSLARHLIAHAANSLTPQQQVFLLSGAIGDTVWVKSPGGERLPVRLLTSAVYEGLLASLCGSRSESSLPCWLTPSRRMMLLSQHKLEPLDPNKPGRYRDPVAQQAPQVDVEALRQQLDQARTTLRTSQQGLLQATRRFTDSLRAERLGSALKEIGAISQLASHYLDAADNPLQLAALPAPAGEGSPSAIRQMLALRQELSETLSALAELPGDVLRQTRVLRSCGEAIALAMSGISSTGLVDLEDAQEIVIAGEAPRLLKDYDATNSTLVQTMQNSPNRSAWSATRVLVAEQVEKFSDPLSECFATPANLTTAAHKADALHPNCFPHDAAGNPLLPPVIIEPGVGIVRWMDDRFLLSFVCTETARPGKELSLSPVDLAVLQIFGLFLARGDIFNYRGERIYTNFMGEYAGEVESKAAVRFTGVDKKMTIVSASSEKDASSREDAVRDYIDFLYCVYNGLPLPKRISPRKVTVILKYCIIGSVERTAVLVLRYVVANDFQTAREILLKLADRQPRKLIALIDAALREDVQLAARYHRDTRRALEEVMGREWVLDAVNAGHFGPQHTGAPPARPKGAEPSADEPEAPPTIGHDYFDV
jgi:hypothetical protein